MNHFAPSTGAYTSAFAQSANFEPSFSKVNFGFGLSSIVYTFAPDSFRYEKGISVWTE